MEIHFFEHCLADIRLGFDVEVYPGTVVSFPARVCI